MQSLAQVAVGFTVGGPAPRLAAARAPAISMDAWLETNDSFRFGTGQVAPAPLGGTGRGDKAKGVGGINGADDFRFGTGSTFPMPYGGMPVIETYADAGVVCEEPVAKAAAPVAAPTGSSFGAQLKQQQSWYESTNSFRFGTGSVAPAPLGGTGLEAIKTAAPTGPADFRFGTGHVVPVMTGGTTNMGEHVAQAFKKTEEAAKLVVEDEEAETEDEAEEEEAEAEAVA